MKTDGAEKGTSQISAGPLLERILSRLDAKKSGAGWMACCPAHEDQNPSLSISEGSGGRVLLHCHAGCSPEAVLTAIGLTKLDLFPEKSTSTTHQKRSRGVLNPGCVIDHDRKSPAGDSNRNQRTTLPATVSQEGAPLSRHPDESAIDWGQCVAAVDDKNIERLGKLRGYSMELGRWLTENNLVGILDGHFAFPVQDNGKVIGAHVRLKKGWCYKPIGTKTRPLVVGELHASDTVHVFESQWDGFAFMDVSGERSGVIITRGASNGALVADLIPERATVYLWAQNDSAGAKWQQDICVNTKAVVKRVRIPEQHKDLNDWTRGGASSDDLLGAIMNSEVIEGVARDAKRAPLTIRTIAEILVMTFDDDSQMILGNGYLTNGERTAVCGMGGVGKTRLIMQLGLCCRAGRNFLAWPTHGRESVFLFLQTENSCRRLKFDLERMLTGFTAEECDRIKNGIFFHTLEQDEDGFLMLDLENSERIADAIARTGANVVVYDPLRDFGSDDLNSDRYMAETLREISRVTKRGNPNRALLVIHHAGTGKAGIQKTLGFDRSSFGRNSKVLFSWARAQINVAPARADDNSLIIIASGKCSNAPEFEPFAARLNSETMLYEIDEGFDMEGWRQELGFSTGRARLKPAIVRDLLHKGQEYGKKRIVELIIEDKGVSKARAYEIVDEAYTRKILRYNKMIKTYELA